MPAMRRPSLPPDPRRRRCRRRSPPALATPCAPTSFLRRQAPVRAAPCFLPFHPGLPRALLLGETATASRSVPTALLLGQSARCTLPTLLPNPFSCGEVRPPIWPHAASCGHPVALPSRWSFRMEFPAEGLHHRRTHSHPPPARLRELPRRIWLPASVTIASCHLPLSPSATHAAWTSAPADPVADSLGRWPSKLIRGRHWWLEKGARTQPYFHRTS